MKELIAAGAKHFQEELQALEECLQGLLDSEIPAVANLGRYMVESGGKRFRPLLTLLFYKLLGEEKPRKAAIELGSVIEMIHLATLAHDDVIDQAATRRNRPALWKSAGNRSAVLEGDFIFSRAFRLLNPYSSEIRSILIEAVEEVLQGELLQEHLRLKLPTEEQYQRVIAGKTASLISAACLMGALTGNPNLKEWQRNSIQQAGMLLGESFQMIDDLLDVFGDESLGKPRWTDQRGGWLTWPYIRLIEKSGSNEHLDLLFSLDLSEDGKREILTAMEKLGIRQEFTAKAGQKIDQMKKMLDWISDSALKVLLFESSDFVLQRSS
ncbi:polyprenyl synthetase family protein [Candidatus Acetothermia bacterium]|nr:polyprenyl synthetase family protein [Candidatus Acetothermia bacterium]MBI3642575.1 polyprenyl synthetase family protein [Candidatus Acetothermia bacterium]